MLQAEFYRYISKAPYEKITELKIEMMKSVDM